MNSNDFVSPEEIVAEVAETLGDTSFNHGVSKSFYELHVHRTMEKLSLNMFYNTVTKDIFNWNVNNNCIIDIPQGMFNIKHMYLFNSNCDKSRCVGSEQAASISGNSYTAITNLKLYELVSININEVDYDINLSVDIDSSESILAAQNALNQLLLGTFTVATTDGHDSLLYSVECTENKIKSLLISTGPGSNYTILFDSSPCSTVTGITDSSCCEKQTANPCCTQRSCWSDFVEPHWKRNFNKFGSTEIKTATIAPGHIDPVYSRPAGYIEQYQQTRSSFGALVYFGIQNGQIAFSDNAGCFKNLRIVSNGFASTNCELPIVPRALRSVCVDMTTLNVCKKLMILFPEYKQMYPVYRDSLYGDGSLQNPGSYLNAERYVKSLNSKQRNDLFEYFGNITIK